MTNATATTDTADHLLAVYLRDHLAGAAAGLALAERCQRANADTPLGTLLADIVAEISSDRTRLREIMDALDVSENPIKAVLGQAAELVGRLKSNGMLTEYSPSSRVLELEGLLAGVDAKRNLWFTLKTVAPTRPAVAAAPLDELIERATSQRDRLQTAHDQAATDAFTSPDPDGRGSPTLHDDEALKVPTDPQQPERATDDGGESDGEGRDGPRAVNDTESRYGEDESPA